MANIVNVLTTTDLSTQLKPDIATKISLITPWMQTPLTTMLFKMNFFNAAQEYAKGSKAPAELATLEKVKNQSFSDFEDEVLGKSSAIASGSALGSATASNNVIVVADASVFKAGDMLALSAVTTGIRREVVYVYSINYTTNTLTLTRSTDFGTLSSAIAATDLAYKIAGAFGEGSSMATILNTCLLYTSDAADE